MSKAITSPEDADFLIAWKLSCPHKRDLYTVTYTNPRDGVTRRLSEAEIPEGIFLKTSFGSMKYADLSAG